MILVGDCREVMAGLDVESVDAIVTDPPYGLGFMGAGWDHDVPGAVFWEAALEVAKPGAHLVAFGGTRLYHRLACAIEDAGWQVRDCLMWLYGGGFPKSTDVAKAMDRRRHASDEIYEVTAWIRAKRDAAGLSNEQIDRAFGFNGMAGHWTSSTTQPAVPTLDQVPRLLEVLGVTVAPKRIRRLIVDLNGVKGQPGEAFAQREVVGQREVPKGHAFAGEVYGGDSSAVTIDETRAATEQSRRWEGWGTALKPAWEPIILARKPLAAGVAVNVGEFGTGALNIEGCRVGANGARWPANLLMDDVAGEQLGAPARFFYCGKATKADRGAGNMHPTVKPTDLMAYLCRLVTPPGGLVLDPFCGSGSTGVAALREGFRFLGIELDEGHAETASQRIEGAQ